MFDVSLLAFVAARFRRSNACTARSLIHLELCVVERLSRVGDVAQTNRGSSHLKQEQLVRPERFELPTSWFVVKRHERILLLLRATQCGLERQVRRSRH